MASFNRVIMIGNLTKDPDYKQQNSGQAVCRLSLASNRQFRNKQTGALVQEVCFIDVDVWGQQAENCRQYLQKGRPVLVEGRLKLDTWEAEGQTKRRHTIVADRVVFLGTAQQAETANEEASVTSTSGYAAAAPTQKTARRSQKSSEGTSEETVGGEAVFKDEPPFEDLPF